MPEAPTACVYQRLRRSTERLIEHRIATEALDQYGRRDLPLRKPAASGCAQAPERSVDRARDLAVADLDSDSRRDREAR